MAGASTADVGQRARPLQRLSTSAAGWDDDAVAQLREGQKIPAVQRQLHELAIADDRADLGVRQLQNGVP